MMATAHDRERAIREKAHAYLAARANQTVGAPMPRPALVKDAAPEIPADVQAWEEAVEQVRKAQELVALPREAFLRYPLGPLGDLIGGVRPNRLHYYVSASNNGKTTFVRSFIEAAIAAGQSCAVMTSETTPEDFRLQMAASSVGVKVGDVSTGEYYNQPNPDVVQSALDTELQRWADYESGATTQLRISSAAGYLTPEKVRVASRHAADLGADWFIIDHVDHVEGSGRTSEYEVSNAVNTAAWRAAMDLDLRVLCTSQLNQDVFRNNPLGMCVPPLDSWVKFGGKKKELGWVMLGGYRPLRPFLDDEERKAELGAFKAGARTIADITLPCLQLRVMKHRDYGERVGASCTLEVRGGKLVSPTRDTSADLHGIRTARGL